MKEPIKPTPVRARLAAAHAIAEELKVDPEHPGTLRLAAALGDTPLIEPPVTAGLAIDGVVSDGLASPAATKAEAATSEADRPDENDPPPLVPVFPRLHDADRHEPNAAY